MKHNIKIVKNVEKVNVWCQNNPSSQDWKMNYLEFCLTTNGEFLLLKLLISQAISYYSWSFCLEHIKSKIWFGFLENNYWRHILLQAIMQIKLANLLSKLLWWNIFKWSASNYIAEDLQLFCTLVPELSATSPPTSASSQEWGVLLLLYWGCQQPEQVTKHE